jgi:hypothetical protein
MLRRLTMGTALAVAMSAAAVMTATPALAKGPIQARITGPGLAHTIVVGGNGEPGFSDRLATLATQTDLFAILFGASGNIPAPVLLRAAPPAVYLGPGYALVYTVPGVTPRPGQTYGQIRQTLYPWAAGGPVIYTSPRQQGFGQAVQISGWFRGGLPLTRVLTRLGVPSLTRGQAAQRARLLAAHPTGEGTPAWLIATIVVLVAAAFAGAVLWLRRRKPAAVLAPGLPRRQP